MPEYPRPMLVREAWLNLNGLRDLTIVDRGAGKPDAFTEQFLVPGPAEDVHLITTAPCLAHKQAVSPFRADLSGRTIRRTSRHPDQIRDMTTQNMSAGE